MKSRLVPLLGALLAALAGAAEPLRFGLISTESANQNRSLWGPVIDAMSKEVGRPVQPFFASDYAGIIEALRFGQVDIAWMGNKAAMEAVDRAGAEVFVRQFDNTSKDGYESILIVRDDSPVRTADDVVSRAKQLVLGIGDPHSTSGFVVPVCHFFGPRGLDPRRGFKITRTSNHEGNLMAVVAGQVDLATNNTQNLHRFTLKFPERAKRIRVVWTSPTIPNDPMVWRRNLAPEAKQAVRAFFLRYGQSGPNREAELASLYPLQIKGFITADDTYLLPVRRLELLRLRWQATVDEALDDSARKARLAEFDAKLEALGK
jgi:phosphonate transport system substrate-binding protein